MPKHRDCVASDLTSSACVAWLRNLLCYRRTARKQAAKVLETGISPETVTLLHAYCDL
jgi:hypothetical protein